jgi:Arc/MetJ-type ribon-helix-helix transcriptional regulator
MARQTVLARKGKRGPAPTGKGQQVVVRMHDPMLSALDSWIERQEQRPTRPEAVRRAVGEWLTGMGLLRPREDRQNLDQHIEHLEGEVAHLKPAASGKPSPAAGMAMLRRGRAKSDLAKAKNTRAKAPK